jgi:ribosomal RNA-processing protein 8
MRQKLVAARFRHLNETLYTTPSSNALSLFRDNPEMFDDYHRGFRLQVDKWPENPVDGYLAAIRQRGRLLSDGRQRRAGKKLNASGTGVSPLPRTGELCVIADLGCGDGQLAQSLDVDPEKGRLKLKVLSYDLQSSNKFVTEADVSKLPLKDGSVDVAIFCLALMGTNWIDFVEEAFRVLRWKGELWIAEIKSRFSRPSTSKRLEHSVGNRTKSGIGPKSAAYGSDAVDDPAPAIAMNDEAQDKKDTDVSAFVEVLRKRGFALQNEDAVDLSNKMFVRLNFVKALSPMKGKCIPETGVQKSTVGRPRMKTRFPESNTSINEVEEASVLKPCVYKSR